jgi:hypothetical protein
MYINLIKTLDDGPYGPKHAVSENIKTTACVTERVFENKVLRRIFGPKRDEVTGEWKKIA